MRRSLSIWLVVFFLLGGGKAQELDPVALAQRARAELELAQPAPDGEAATVLTVVDALGVPVPGALVLVDPVGGRDAATTAERAMVQQRFSGSDERLIERVRRWGACYSTDAEGRVRLPRVSATSLEVTVICGIDGSTQTLEQGRDRELTLPSRDRLRVHVHGRRKGSGVRDVEVTLLTGEREVGTATTGSDGRVVFTVPAWAKTSGLYLEIPDLGDVDALIPVNEQRSIAVRFPPTCDLRLILQGANGRPRPGLRRVTAWATRLRWADSTNAIAGGDSAAFSRVPLNAELEFLVELDGVAGAIAAVGESSPVDGGLAVVAVRVGARQPVLQLRVRGVDGEFLADSEVGIGLRSGAWERVLKATTDGSGALTIAIPVEALASGSDSVSVFVHHRRGPDRGEYGGGVSLDWDVAPRGVHDLGEFALELGQVLVAGKIVDPGGEPVRGVALRADHTYGGELARATFFEHRVVTDAAGRFVLRENAPDAMAVALRVESDAHVRGDRRFVARGDENARVVVQPLGRIATRLFAAGDLRGAELELKVLAAGESHVVSLLRSENGVFPIEQLGPGEYDLEVGPSRRHRGLRIPGVVVPGGESCADARLHPIDWREHFRLVCVAVRDENGVPLANVGNVWARVTDRGGQQTVGIGRLTDAAGSTTFFVPREDATVEVDIDGYLVAQKKVTGDALAFQLERGPVVEISFRSDEAQRLSLPLEVGLMPGRRYVPLVPGVRRQLTVQRRGPQRLIVRLRKSFVKSQPKSIRESLERQVPWVLFHDIDMTSEQMLVPFQIEVGEVMRGKLAEATAILEAAPAKRR